MAEYFAHFSEYSFPIKYITGMAKTDGKTEVNRKIVSPNWANGFK